MGFEERIAEAGFAHAARLAAQCDFLRAGPLDSDELDQDVAERGLAVLVIGPEGNLRRANGAARLLLAQCPGDPLGKNLFKELLPGTNSRLFRGLVERAQSRGVGALYFPFTLVQAGRLRDLEVLLVRGSGEERWLFLREHARHGDQAQAA